VISLSCCEIVLLCLYTIIRI